MRQSCQSLPTNPGRRPAGKPYLAQTTNQQIRNNTPGTGKHNPLCYPKQAKQCLRSDDQPPSIPGKRTPKPSIVSTLRNIAQYIKSTIDRNNTGKLYRQRVNPTQLAFDRRNKDHTCNARLKTTINTDNLKIVLEATNGLHQF